MRTSPLCLFLTFTVSVTGVPTRSDDELYSVGRGDTDDTNAQPAQLIDDGTIDTAAQLGGTEQASLGDSEVRRGANEVQLSMPSLPRSSHDGQVSKEDTPSGRYATSLRSTETNDGVDTDFQSQRPPDFEMYSGPHEDTESQKTEQSQFPDDDGMKRAERRGLGVRAPSRASGHVGSAESDGSGSGGRLLLGRAGGGSQRDEQGQGSQIRGQYNRHHERRLDVGGKNQARMRNLLGASNTTSKDVAKIPINGVNLKIYRATCRDKTYNSIVRAICLY